MQGCGGSVDFCNATRYLLPGCFAFPVGDSRFDSYTNYSRELRCVKEPLGVVTAQQIFYNASSDCSGAPAGAITWADNRWCVDQPQGSVGSLVYCLPSPTSDSAN